MALAASVPAQGTRSDIDWDTLLAGEVIVESIDNPHGIAGVRAMFVVSASRESIWQMLVDYKHFQELFEGIDKIKVLKEDERGAQVEFWVDAVLTDLHYVLLRHYVDPRYRLTWKRVSGDLKTIEGSWEILDTPYPGVKLLIYDSYVDIGAELATSLIRLGAKRKAGHMGYRLRTWLEKQNY